MDVKIFGSYIKNLRKQAKLTMRDLSEKTGVSIAYISQIENGRKGLPKPEILYKLHAPLNVGYDDLMIKAGYISAETRNSILPETAQIIESYEDLNELVSYAADLFEDSVTDNEGNLVDTFREHLLEGEDGITEEELNVLTEDPNSKTKAFDLLTVEEKVEFLNMVIKGFVDRNIDPSEVFKSNKQKASENQVPILRVPVLGHIAAGEPILADDHIEEYIEIPNMWNLKPSEAIVLKVKGDSMIGSRIFEGDKVVIKLQSHVENGEIAVVNINGDEATLKRVKKTETGQVILYPDNPKYDPIFITDENARIIGKVVQVMFEP